MHVEYVRAQNVHAREDALCEEKGWHFETLRRRELKSQWRLVAITSGEKDWVLQQSLLK